MPPHARTSNPKARPHAGPETTGHARDEDERRPNEHYLSLVIPLYNEAHCLKDNFETLKTFLSSLNRPFEVILVDDGSTDATPDIIRDILTAHPEARLIKSRTNRGKGHAVRTGVLHAAGRYVVFTDADLAVPVAFIGGCLKRLEKRNPVVIGSRHLPHSAMEVREAPFRQFLGEIFRKGARKVLWLGVSDITCGLKGFEKEAARSIFSRSRIEGWGYDAEILFLARKLGYSVSEIPVSWYHSFDSKVKVASASCKTLIEIFQIGYYYFAGKYHI